MSSLSDTIGALNAVLEDAAVTTVEHPASADKNISFTWNDPTPPQSVMALFHLLEQLNCPEGDVCELREQALVATRPYLLFGLGLSDRVATLFLTKRSLLDAVSHGACLDGDDLLSMLESAQANRRRLCTIWTEPAFRVGDVVICPLFRANDEISLSVFPRSEFMVAEQIQRLVTVQQEGFLPRPDLVTPVELLEGGEGGTAYKAFRVSAAAQYLGTLAKELPGKGQVILSGPLARPARVRFAEDLDLSHFDALQSTAVWIFDLKQAVTERHQIASRTLSERLGPVRDGDVSILAATLENAEGLDENVRHAYQAYINKELDAFFEHQRDMINEVKNLTSAFADKARGLVAGLARDALAASILAVLASLRIGSTTDVSSFPDRVLYVIAVLIAAVGVMQVGSVVVDLCFSWSDYRRWLRRSAVLLSNKEQIELVARPMMLRRNKVVATIVLVSLGYIALCIGIVNFKHIAMAEQTLTIEQQNTEEGDHTGQPEAGEQESQSGDSTRGESEQ